ncbi:MAG: preprotein translocase subunit SecA [Patescibacteria group bacterium]|nr:preprotein translocase subunit SecA [Patescibacteria group bacterium]
MPFLSNLFNNPARKSKKYAPIVAIVNDFEAAISSLSDEQLCAKTANFKARIEESKKQKAKSQNEEEILKIEKEVLDLIMPEAFAVVREAAKRTLGQRHFDVQIMGGAILHDGNIAEMRTGEGKTLVATLPAYLNALTGRGVHVVTVNDYLSRRDAVWMGQIYNALGLSVGVVNHDSSFIYDPKHRTVESENKAAEASNDPLNKEVDTIGSFHVVHEFLRPVSRQEAYNADITYGTNNEFGFDYLRDNLEYDPARLRQRPFNYAIVDEIDSILIDEARTPLIISAPTIDSENLYQIFAGLVSTFKENEDYTVEEKHRTISLTPGGITKAEKKLGLDNIYTDRGIKYVHHLETAVKAKALYQKDKHYVVKNNEIVIVDEFTGRLQPGRRWSEGLHQAIEAKEGVAVQKESRTFASITFQNYFRLYKKLAGMTGTAATSSEEFYKVYGLDVVVLPTNKPIARHDNNDLMFRTEVGKLKAIARKIKELNDKGQPVLVGTVSIEKNEVLSQFLKAEGIAHEILNAKNHEREGEIIAQAGRPAAVTIATNMAGRGVDIRLGGNPGSAEAYEKVKGNGGLFVLGTERHEARRIDNQLRGRSGRQGDPGETQFFVSLEDSLMRVFAGDTVRGLMDRLGMPEDQPIENRMVSRALESAQTKIEGFNFDSRKHVLQYDDVLNTQRKAVYDRRRTLLLGTPEVIEEKLNEVIEGRVKAETATSSEGPFAVRRHENERGGSPPPTRVPRRNVAVEASKNNLYSIIDQKIAEIGRERFLAVVRQLMLQVIDMFWVEHLELMEYSRSSVNLRAYGQRDPLVEYKREGLRLFKEMQAAIDAKIIELLPHVAGGIITTPQPKLQEVRTDAETITGSGGPTSTPTSDLRNDVGRNEPCPCGSGKKFKNCGLKNTAEHQKMMAGK